MTWRLTSRYNLGRSGKCLDDLPDGRQRGVEVLPRVGRHQAQWSSARRSVAPPGGSRRWCRRRHRRAPSRATPPASPRRRRPAPRGWWRRCRRGASPAHHLEAERAQASCRYSALPSRRRNSSGFFGADHPQRRQRRADRGGHRRGAEDEGARGDPQVLDHVGRAGDEAAAGGEALGEGPHPQVDLVLESEVARRRQLAAPRTPGSRALPTIRRAP